MRAPEVRPPLVVAILGLAAGVALATPALPVGVRAIAALGLAFVLPGTAIALAFLPRVSLHRSERLAIALGGSMSVAIASAFVLHVLPSGLTAATWAAMLGGITVLGGLVGWLRVLRPPASTLPPGAVVPGPWVSGPPDVAVMRSKLVSPASIAMLAAAGVLVALSMVIARSGMAFGPTASFTELWVLPADSGSAVHVGVANHEGAAERYRLVITVDGRPLGGPVELLLADGSSTDAVVALPPGSRASRTVEARLWRDEQDPDDPPVRSVRATVEQDPTAVP